MQDLNRGDELFVEYGVRFDVDGKCIKLVCILIAHSELNKQGFNGNGYAAMGDLGAANCADMVEL